MTRDYRIQLAEQELQKLKLRVARVEKESYHAQIDQAKLQLDAQNQQMRAEQFDKRLASQEAQTAARIDSAMQRELLKQRGQ